jgi:hypothetical protein
MMTISLEPEQRDALFSQLMVDLGLFGDLQAAMRERDEEECYRLGFERQESQAEWDELMAIEAACQAVLDQARD